MKSTIKGLKVTVNVAIKANEIATCNFRHHNESGERRNEEVYKGLDINVGADIELAESDGEVDLIEISDLLHISLKDQVKEQVKECLDEKHYKDDSEPGVHYRTSEEELRRVANYCSSDTKAFEHFNKLLYGKE